jgi:hypothetical protein
MRSYQQRKKDDAEGKAIIKVSLWTLAPSCDGLLESKT